MDERRHDLAQGSDSGPRRFARLERGAELAGPEAASTSMAIAAASALLRQSWACRAAIMPIETWSSWPAEEVIESTEAGWASVFISETREAAVY